MAPLRALLASALLSGCASFVRPDGARTLAPGTGEILVAPSAYLTAREDNNFLNVDLVYRRGIAARADAGLRLNLVAFSGDVKVALWRGDRVEVAVAPSLGYGVDITWTGSANNDDPEWALQAGLPVLVSINLGRYQLTLTPQLLYQHVGVLPSGVLNAGGTIAFGRMSGGGFGVYPALAIWKALDPRQPLESLRGPGPLVFQPALVFRWGP